MNETNDQARLRIKAAAPDWFHQAIARQGQSRRVTVEGCPIHYLSWRDRAAPSDRGGILFVHGGGAHAHWWSHIAPFFADDFRVAAMDLSGMGDSGNRTAYDASLRAAEMRGVIADAGLGPRPFVVGHSFGGYMSMRLASQYGDELGGVVIVDSPIRSPEEEAARKRRPGPMGGGRTYADFESAVARFRLRPRQPCDNRYIVEFIARHSIKQVADGWTWKFDTKALGARRFGEPFHEYLEAARCRSALFFGENSALVSYRTASYMSGLMGPEAPIVAIPGAHHHVMLDQPLAFVAALRTLLDGWLRADSTAPG
ncbi:MAG: alpha/beta hydrolase [Alphaproteobacteria bacterium]|nr:alpha/beta hydrolase [Alphaproteobacteria bacterium]MDP6565513.1 alpha/beta hydrolase [Alphaproteobacteria bacterium]